MPDYLSNSPDRKPGAQSVNMAGKYTLRLVRFFGGWWSVHACMYVWQLYQGAQKQGNNNSPRFESWSHQPFFFSCVRQQYSGLRVIAPPGDSCPPPSISAVALVFTASFRYSLSWYVVCPLPFPSLVRQLEHQEFPAAMNVVCLSFPGEVGVSLFLLSSFISCHTIVASQFVAARCRCTVLSRSSWLLAEFGQTWKLLGRIGGGYNE